MRYFYKTVKTRPKSSFLTLLLRREIGPKKGVFGGLAATPAAAPNIMFSPHHWASLNVRRGGDTPKG